MLPRGQSRISDHLAARATYIWTRQFGQHYASHSLTNAADAQQKIAFRLKVAIIVDRQCDGFVDRSELAREVRDRRIGQGLSLRVDNAAVLAILPFRQARDDARSDRLQLTQPTVGLRGWCPRRGLEQFTILTNVRRIDPISLVATQLGAHEVSNLGGIDDADNMAGLVQRARDAETITPGGFQTGVNPLDLLGNQPIRRWRHPSGEFVKLLVRTLVQLEMLTSSVFLQTSIPNIPSITVLSLHLISSTRAPLRATLYTGSTLMRVPGYRPV